MPKREHDDDSNGKGSKPPKTSKKSTHTPPPDVQPKDENNCSNAIPIFLKKTYRMIETCNPEICSWTADGEMFVVKNPELFALDIIPQYFDHNKFSSFARQLNFYGFRKIQTKPIRNEDFDKSTAKHVTFFNEKFKRGRYDLLKEIQRSTRGGGAQASLADQAREMETMRGTVATLESRVQDLETRWQELSIKVEREIQAKVELAVMDLLSSRQPHHTSAALQAQYMGMPSLPTSLGDASLQIQRAERSFGSIGRNPHGTWENPLLGPQAARAFSTASASSQGAAAAAHAAAASQGGGGAASDATGVTSRNAGATLPPHPKQKSLPPPTMGLQTTASGGVNNMSRLSSANSSLLLRNAWEDKFYSTLMMTDGASRAASLAGLAGGMAGAGGVPGGNVSGLAALAAAQQMQNQNKAGQYAAYMQDRAQRGVSVGRGGGGAVDARSGHSSSSLERQTTAEILLEAAGELGKNNTGKVSKV
mmetsp:Transcript_4436/g.9589  ORF Transcript_4436/g.9589 Transcript_4436/m.9589 type:complete len:478 (+) Transcript_4436:167-1600(+)|eukprot:CAMPEP_0172558102 /NCGR_PEP_ID=MMETSP1067-20121228/77234_1 /TAXON_ID=265564 ORGANISM="Thalassiosira punctigera, Strain Tpunct2005C2" /NCGR_SAMPLE_ID=MMETSP1067 /ASSEMBLY_ACC=CAM_ASM_000444 /LENGTH=477 /DNA_ID=CAMNT_0013347377 /DNA_START=76 /DNA_END=1509 /DNA_ORIENTATION=+